MIAENLDRIRQDILVCAESSGRKPEDIRLIAVSKYKPAEAVKEAYDHGQREFGENHVQEICDKLPALPEDINWHMIGNLQRNKVKYIVDKVKMIHSVGSVALAEQIEKEAVKKNCDVDILLEVNIGEEDSKSGFSYDGALEAVDTIALLPHVHIRGLMTVAPYVADPETNRPVFRKLRQLGVDIDAKKLDNVCMCEYSMGMSNDYKVAIEEGATFIRVGTSIFGERDYTK